MTFKAVEGQRGLWRSLPSQQRNGVLKTLTFSSSPLCHPVSASSKAGSALGWRPAAGSRGCACAEGLLSKALSCEGEASSPGILQETFPSESLAGGE